MMNKTLSLTTGFSPLGALLSGSAPDGVAVEFAPPMERRGFDFNVQVNLDIKLVIDLTKISAMVFAAWLVRNIRGRNREIEVHVNGKQIPKDEPAAIEFIAKEIASNEQCSKQNK